MKFGEINVKGVALSLINSTLVHSRSIFYIHNLEEFFFVEVLKVVEIVKNTNKLMVMKIEFFEKKVKF